MGIWDQQLCRRSKYDALGPAGNLTSVPDEVGAHTPTLEPVLKSGCMLI